MRQLLGLLPLDGPRPEFGKSAYRNTKGHSVSGLSIGYAIRNSTKTAADHELTDLDLIESKQITMGCQRDPPGEMGRRTGFDVVDIG